MNEPDWAEVVAQAVRAPSIHNTQPWLFTGTPDHLDLHVDRRRALPVIDRTARQQVISCGIAGEFAAIALRAAGFGVEVALLPDPGDPDHLMTVRVTGRLEATEEDVAAVAAITQRHTVRAPFQARAMPADLLERLQVEAASYGVWSKHITREEEEVATVFLIARAEEMEQADPAYVAELERWVRTDADSGDGVPIGAVPSEDPAARPSNWLVRDFLAGQRESHVFLPSADQDAPPPEVERPTVLILGTDNDDRSAWLQAGRALGRLLLHATSAGLAASPLTQALDWPATRAQLHTRLSLLGHPQMLLRIGYPVSAETEPTVISGRRPVSDVLTVHSAP